MVQMKSDMGALITLALTLIIFSEILPLLCCRLLNILFIYGLEVAQSVQQ
jgi:hypothetical protein